MPSIHTKDLSSLAQAALNLESDFAEMERLRGDIEHVSLESESGFERAGDLLSRFGTCGARIGGRIQELAKALNDARERAEGTAEYVTHQANLFQQRKETRAALLGKFESLVTRVRELSAQMAKLKKSSGEEFSPQEKTLLRAQLSEPEAELTSLVEEAGLLKEEARNANMKNLERDADSMGQSLNAARRKLSDFAIGAVLPSADA